MRYLIVLLVAPVISFAHLPTLLVSGSDIGHYDPVTGQFLGIVIDYTAGGHYPIKILPTPFSTIFVFTSDGRIKEYQQDGTLIRQLPIGPYDTSNPTHASSGCFGPNGTIIISNYNSVTERDYVSGNTIRMLFQGSGINDAQFNPTTGNLFVISNDRFLREFEFPSGNLVNTDASFDGTPTEIIFNSLGEMLALDSYGSRVMARRDGDWNVFYLASQLQQIGGIAKHPLTGNIFVISSSFGTIYEINGTTGLFVDFIIASTEITNYRKIAFSASEECAPVQGDLDGDRDVDLTDLAILLSNFGSTCP